MVKQTPTKPGRRQTAPGAMKLLEGTLHCHCGGQALQVFTARDFDGARRAGCFERAGELALFFDDLLQLAGIMIQVINHALPFLRLEGGLSPIIYGSESDAGPALETGGLVSAQV